MKRKIYIATSWKLAVEARAISHRLRGRGHEVFCFCDPDRRPAGTESYVFDIHEYRKTLEKNWDWKSFLQLQEPRKAFAVDKSGLDWADTTILIIPSGRSAHIEAGYNRGQGKDLFIIGELEKGEQEVMYGFATATYHLQDLNELLDDLEKDDPIEQLGSLNGEAAAEVGA